MGIARNLRRLARKQDAVAAKKPQRKAMMEPLEPRLLLSADFAPGTTAALLGGLDQFGDRLDDFLTPADPADLFNTQVPFIVQVNQTEDGSEQVAPTLGSLFSVQVDTNGPAEDGVNATLDGLDADDDGTVDAGEFIQGWLFDKIDDYPDPTDPGFGLWYWNETGGLPSGIDSADFANWLAMQDSALTVGKPGGGNVTISLGCPDRDRPDRICAQRRHGLRYRLQPDRLPRIWPSTWAPRPTPSNSCTTQAPTKAKPAPSSPSPRALISASPSACARADRNPRAKSWMLKTSSCGMPMTSWSAPCPTIPMTVRRTSKASRST